MYACFETTCSFLSVQFPHLKIVFSHCYAALLLLLLTAILPYCCTAILLYSYTAVLPYCCTAMLPFCYTSRVGYRQAIHIVTWYFAIGIPLPVHCNHGNNQYIETMATSVSMAALWGLVLVLSKKEIKGHLWPLGMSEQCVWPYPGWCVPITRVLMVYLHVRIFPGYHS